MTPEDFKAIRKRLGRTQLAMAKLLEISPRSVWAYENGEDIPQVTRFAMMWLDMGNPEGFID